jgi:carboxypeptidase C (cathepsin A)
MPPLLALPERSMLAAFLMLGLIAICGVPVLAEADRPSADAERRAEATAPARGEAEPGGGSLPESRTTRHALALAGRSLDFDATAGSITLTGPRSRAEAEIGFVAYAIRDADRAARPVTFVVNGGPGAASAYLHLGAIGPWRLPMDGASIAPSQGLGLVANAETWLEFTDLVFVDPVGTGFSRLVESDDRLRNRYLSIDGDIDALADFILRWLTVNGRVGSPKYFVGESYGGFRGPLLAEKLQTDHGVGLQGMILLSPVLDFGWWQQPGHAPLPRASLLPSLAAAAMEARGAFSETELRAAEDYAAGPYVADLLRGPRDAAAVGRIVARVSELTGLDRETVERAAGRIDADDFARELLRDEDRLASIYDTTVSSADPAPGDARPRAADPVLDAMTAPLTGAMIAHYRDTLGWLPDRRYLLLNGGVSRSWDWESGRGQPEAVGALRRVLALDPGFRLLIAHGYTDLVTPYFATELILRQLPDFGPGSRVRQRTYRGGHMFYLRDASRRAFRDDARALYAGPAD